MEGKREKKIDCFSLMEAFKVSEEQTYNYISIDPEVKYFVPEGKQEKFLCLFDELLKCKKAPSIAEIPDDICRFVVDIDLAKAGKRQGPLYEATDIANVARLIASSIFEKTDTNVVKFYVMEKPPRMLGNIVKHGFHLVSEDRYAYKIRRYISEKRYPEIRDMFTGKTDNPDSAFDVGVLDNPWLLYGCCKPDKDVPFAISKTFEFKGPDDVKETKVNQQELGDATEAALKLSINRSDTDTRSFKSEEIREDIDAWYAMRFTDAAAEAGFDAVKSMHIEKAKTLMTFIVKDRADSHHYGERICIGRALKSIANSKDLMNAWINFVRGGKKKFNDRNLVLSWNYFSDLYSVEKAFGILHSYAKKDSKKKYEKWKSSCLEEHLLSIGMLTHYDIALVLSENYGQQFRYDPDTKTWYERKDFYWKRVANDMPQEMSEILSQKFSQIFRDKMDMLDEEMENVKPKSPESKILTRKLKNCILNIKELGNHPFKTHCVKEACSQMSSDGFSAKLDSGTRYLIFKNGYLDLMDIDKGLQTDPCDTGMSLVIDYPYLEDDGKSPLSELSKAKARVMKIWDQIFPVKEEGQFVLLKFATGLRGNQEQETVVMVGPGSSGKSTAYDFYAKALDVYAYEVSSDVAVSGASLTDSPTPYLANFRGKRIVIMPELQKKGPALGFIKWVTGSSKISARLLHQNPIDFAVTFKIFLDTNYPINLQDRMDYSIMRRFLNIPTRARFFPKEKMSGSEAYEFERDDSVKLMPNETIYKQAFMSILVDNFKLLLKTGKPQPPEFIRDYNLTFIENNHSVHKFMRKRIVADPDGGSISLNSFFNKYKDWYLVEYSRKAPILSREEVEDVLIGMNLKYDKAAHKLKNHRMNAEVD